MRSTSHSLNLALLAVMVTATSGHAFAQTEYAISFDPRSGDVWIDRGLGDFNRYAQDDINGFSDEVAVRYGAPRDLVQEYVIDRRWPPGDVYFACALGHYTGRPCREVLDVYAQDHGQGWGVIAKRMGIAPGSAEFHALKADLGNSHAKWQGDGRPARPDHQGGDRAPHSGPDHGRPDTGKPGDKGKGKDKGKDNGKGRGHEQS